MVHGPGVEPGSTDFQSVAEMTALAHHACYSILDAIEGIEPSSTILQIVT